jgi:hypothetical protein
LVINTLQYDMRYTQRQKREMSAGHMLNNPYMFFCVLNL